MKCQICSSNKTKKFLSLGKHPNPDGFLDKHELKKPEPLFELDVFFCPECKLVQLGKAPDPKLLFTKHFVYTTGSSGELVRNFQELVEKLVKNFSLTEKDLAVDIGSNDGTLLENYLKHNVRVLGIDPSEAAKLAEQKNIPTMPVFFNEATAKKILQKEGKASVITATNVFAHIKDIDSFLEGVKLLLKEKGVFIEESHYLLDMVEKMEYDSIYAEHLRYYSIKPLIVLFEKYGMMVFDAERISTHGGSLRVFACKKRAFHLSENVKKIMEQEEKAGLYEKKTFSEFAKKVLVQKEKLVSLLKEIKKQNKKIVGLGAPAKGNTLLNYCGIGTETLDYIGEKPNLKLGKYSPGMHIPIVDEARIFEEQPDYSLLLSWNLKDIIIPKLRAKGFKGKIIVPIPEPEIL